MMPAGGEVKLTLQRVRDPALRVARLCLLTQKSSRPPPHRWRRPAEQVALSPNPATTAAPGSGAAYAPERSTLDGSCCEAPPPCGAEPP
jgi:hypothetical protein